MTGSPLFQPVFAPVSRCVASGGRRRATIAAGGRRQFQPFLGWDILGQVKRPGS